MNDVHMNPPSFLGTRPRSQKKTFPGPNKVTVMTPKKNLALKYIEPPLFGKMTGSIGSCISNLPQAIGGHHPVLYFDTEMTEKYSTAMC